MPAGAIVERIAGGDKTALAELHALFALSLRRVARRVLRSNECAEEVVCDVFVHVWQSAGRYDPARGSVEAWLRIVTRNRAIDRFRSYRRHAPLAELWTADSPSLEYLSPEDALVNLETRARIHAALVSLTPLRRRLVALSFFEGLTHAEISLSTGLPLGTVKSHVKRALTGLRDSLSVGLVAQTQAAAPGLN